MKKCKICGKEVERIVKGMCINHYNQSIYKPKKRTKYGPRKIKKIKLKNVKKIKSKPKYKCGPNNYEVYNTYAEIILCNRSGNERARTKIDLEDIELCKTKRWSVQSMGYVQYMNPERKIILLHRFIMNAPKGKLIDHINHDTLDNRRSNLRIVTPHQSNLNQYLRSDNTSGHKGVSWFKRDSIWETYIWVDGKKKTLGKFKDLHDAIKIRKEAEDKYYDIQYISR